MSTVKKFIFTIILVFNFLQPLGAEVFQGLTHPSWNQLTFDYPIDQLGYLKQLPRPQSRITAEQLTRLNKEVSYQLKSRDLSEIDQTIIPPYLANAQKDFAWLSYLLTGELAGDLGPLTLWTLQLFFDDVTLPSVQESCFDVYTCSIASLVVSKVAQRLDAERKQIANYPIKRGVGIWTPTSPGYTGLDFGSAKTWFLTSSKEYMADAPVQNQDFWKSQTAQIKDEQHNLDGEKVQAVFDWAGLTSPHAGSWEDILTVYMEEKNIPVISQLYIRSLFLSALADSNAASFNSKYTYWVMRPSQRDQAVNPLIIVPNHPSYPSAHSTIGATAAVVLAAVFPKDKERWDHLADEAGMSRIWGGIHYPVDHKVGLKLGDQVGQAVVQRVSRKENTNTKRF